MKRFYQILTLACSMFIIATPLLGQKTVNQSEKSKPTWLTQAPKPLNKTFYYQVTETNSNDLNDARKASLTSLSTYIQQTNTIKGAGISDIKIDDTGDYDAITFTYKIEGQAISITSQKIDEYWQYISYPNGKNEYRLFTLFAVANSTIAAQFDKITFSKKYGARGMLRSMVVPGWGQIYKGSTVKGSLILGGELALAASIIYAESERSSYSKKVKRTQNVDHIRDYKSKMDNYETVRNVCIGAVAALYVYNVIDALASDGKKRTIVKKNKNYMTVIPVATPSYSGISLCYNF